MNRCLALALILLAWPGASFAAEGVPGHSAVLLEEQFDSPLSKEWSRGLGTWEAKDGVLRGFESGPRRHGPVTVRNLALRDAVLECEFRLEGKATFAGVIFNGSQERGHIVHVVMGKDQLRIIANPKKGENLELIKEPFTLEAGAWHHVKIEIKGPVITVNLNGKVFTAEAPAIAEEKLTFGLGGDSGGPEGEKAGALEFRKLKIYSDP
jgi:hypothetical protein